MSTSRSPEELLHQVVLLEREGMRRRAIARALGISRNTVRKLLLLHLNHRFRTVRDRGPDPLLTDGSS